MRYKIVCQTFNDGTKWYNSYVKGFFGWDGLRDDGCTGSRFKPATTFKSREDALASIDKHYGHSTATITVEFIQRP